MCSKSKKKEALKEDIRCSVCYWGIELIKYSSNKNHNKNSLTAFSTRAATVVNPGDDKEEAPRLTLTANIDASVKKKEGSVSAKPEPDPEEE